jgi:hypothetical protein
VGELDNADTSVMVVVHLYEEVRLSSLPPDWHAHLCRHCNCSISVYAGAPTFTWSPSLGSTPTSRLVGFAATPRSGHTLLLTTNQFLRIISTEAQEDFDQICLPAILLYKYVPASIVTRRS